MTQNSSPLIRLANGSDFSAIIDIYNQSIPSHQSTADTEPVTLESREAWFSAHNPEARPLYILEENGRPAAWLSMEDFYGRPAYLETAEFSLYVDSNCRGRGYGRTLLKYGLEQAPGLGIRKVLGFIFAHNTPSLNLFKSQGFKEWGRLPDVARLNGGLFSLLILGCHLAPRPEVSG